LRSAEKTFNSVKLLEFLKI